MPMQIYYYNTLTNESSWEKPDSFTGDEQRVAEAPVPVAQAAVPGTDWLEVKCHDGRKYYYNKAKQETAWTVPEGVGGLETC
jgi:transcription elongation regulator 1